MVLRLVTSVNNLSSIVSRKSVDINVTLGCALFDLSTRRRYYFQSHICHIIHRIPLIDNCVYTWRRVSVHCADQNNSFSRASALDLRVNRETAVIYGGTMVIAMKSTRHVALCHFTVSTPFLFFTEAFTTHAKSQSITPSVNCYRESRQRWSWAVLRKIARYSHRRRPRGDRSFYRFCWPQVPEDCDADDESFSCRIIEAIFFFLVFFFFSILWERNVVNEWKILHIVFCWVKVCFIHHRRIFSIHSRYTFLFHAKTARAKSGKIRQWRASWFIKFGNGKPRV